MKIWFFIAVAFLGGALLGFMVCSFFDKYRLNVMLSLSSRALEDAPYITRLKQVADTWEKLRVLFFSWRGGLSPQQYFAAAELITELDERIGFNINRDTEKIEESSS